MENKNSKYFKYALGEVILVVIGILIALQINNWNEQRKASQLEAEYYCRLLEDVIQDHEQIDDLINLSKDRLKAANHAVRLLQKENPNQIEVATQTALSIKAIYSEFHANNSAFEDLKSGANLNIIKDKTIIKALNTYFNNLESLISIIKINGQNAVDVYNAHDDSFVNGITLSSIRSGILKNGMEPDVKAAIKIDSSTTLSGAVQYRLYNEALRYTMANARQLELYQVMKDFSSNMTSLLQKKCTYND